MPSNEAEALEPPLTLSDPNRCRHAKTVAGVRFVCVRRDHSWENDNVATHRRRKGQVVEPDRHWMRKETEVDA